MVLLSDTERERLAKRYVELCTKYNQMAERRYEDEQNHVSSDIYHNLWMRSWEAVGSFEEALSLTGVCWSATKNKSNVYTQVRVENVPYDIPVPAVFRDEEAA